MSNITDTQLEAYNYKTALQDISAGIGCCDICGVEHEANYEGPCIESGVVCSEGRYKWARVCPGNVSLRGTATKALRDD